MSKLTKTANALRALCMDAITLANSGHPGMPLGMADIADVLWREFLQHNPSNPKMINRDRFVMSNGHGVMLHYALLHFSGFDLSLDDIKAFRQLGSKTPGHPEIDLTPGVEASTGPLGQGLAYAVGLAFAEQLEAKHYNRPDFSIIDHYTYCFVGDGCLMEGISHEVASFAGVHQLKKLIVFWDDNAISIDGAVNLTWQDDTKARFQSYGWHVEELDGHDPKAIAAGIQAAKSSLKPSLLCCKTTIGYGAAFAGTAKAHGTPMKAHEVSQAKEALSCPEARFIHPADIYQAFDRKTQGQVLEQEWQDLFAQYQIQYPELAQEFTRRQAGLLPKNWQENLQVHLAQYDADEPLSTRKASQRVLDSLSADLPELLGGSADLSDSNSTLCKHSQAIAPASAKGNYIYYGVREFGMMAMMLGLDLAGQYIVYGGTFLCFSDYARNAIRMAALMARRVIFVLSHDSIGLGEDGPSHQPIEQLGSLRLMPNIDVWRPANLRETSTAWQSALLATGRPQCLILSRQNCPSLSELDMDPMAIAKGAYIAYEPKTSPKLIVIATGSELSLGLGVVQSLKLPIRLVSMPSSTVFKRQTKAYQAEILPNHLRQRVAIEAGASAIWAEFTGLDGLIIGIDQFGVSAPGAAALKSHGFDLSKIVQRVKDYIKT